MSKERVTRDSAPLDFQEVVTSFQRWALCPHTSPLPQPVFSFHRWQSVGVVSELASYYPGLHLPLYQTPRTAGGLTEIYHGGWKGEINCSHISGTLSFPSSLSMGLLSILLHRIPNTSNWASYLQIGKLETEIIHAANGFPTKSQSLSKQHLLKFWLTDHQVISGERNSKQKCPKQWLLVKCVPEFKMKQIRHNYGFLNETWLAQF